MKGIPTCSPKELARPDTVFFTFKFWLVVLAAWNSGHCHRTLAVPDCPQKAQLPGTKAKESKTIVNTCNLGVTWYDHTLPRNNKRNKVHQGIRGSCNSSPIHALPALQSTALESPQLATVTVRVEPAVRSQKRNPNQLQQKQKSLFHPRRATSDASISDTYRCSLPLQSTKATIAVLPW